MLNCTYWRDKVPERDFIRHKPFILARLRICQWLPHCWIHFCLVSKSLHNLAASYPANLIPHRSVTQAFWYSHTSLLKLTVFQVAFPWHTPAVASRVPPLTCQHHTLLQPFCPGTLSTHLCQAQSQVMGMLLWARKTRALPSRALAESSPLLAWHSPVRIILPWASPPSFGSLSSMKPFEIPIN